MFGQSKSYQSFHSFPCLHKINAAERELNLFFIAVLLTFLFLFLTYPIVCFGSVNSGYAVGSPANANDDGMCIKHRSTWSNWSVFSDSRHACSTTSTVSVVHQILLATQTSDRLIVPFTILVLIARPTSASFQYKRDVSKTGNRLQWPVRRPVPHHQAFPTNK